MKKFAFFFLVLVCCRILISCSKQNEQALMPPTTSGNSCDTVNMKFATNVVPILSTSCYNCHGNGRSLGGINMDTYARVKELANDGSLIGTITHASGYSPMPQGTPQLSTCNINKIKDWVNRGAPNN